MRHTWEEISESQDFDQGQEFIEAEFFDDLLDENEKLKEALRLVTYSLEDCIYEIIEADLPVSTYTDEERLNSAKGLL